MHQIKMVMADVDGTLVTPEKDLTARARRTVFYLRETGFKFTIISSRPPYGLRSLSRDLELDQPVAAFSGGMLVTPDGNPIRTYFLDAELIPSMLTVIRQFGLSPRLYTAECWLIESPDQPHIRREACTVETEPTIVSDFQPYFGEILKLTGVSDNHEAVAECRKALQARLGGQASILCSQPYYLDITHPLANKGDALVRIAKIQNILPEDVAVIGDSPSDVPMFSKAGFSIAMGNASDAVKRQADYVTDANTSDGFSNAMEACILRERFSAVPLR
jgi:Cof subfamily protein (haloacid dehalogenase superfamily)